MTTTNDWRVFFPSNSKLFLWTLVLGLMLFATNALPAHTTPVDKVIDRSGTEVLLPLHRNRILVTCYGGASHEIAILGGAQRIVGHPSMHRFPLLLAMYPQLTDMPDAGSFDNVNIEFAMSLKPDLVVASIVSARTNKRIQKLGMPVVTVGTGWTNVELLLKEFAMMGEVLGAQDRAGELVAFWRARLDLIQKRTAHLARDRRKTVYYCSAGSPLKTEGSIGWGESFISAAGGKNVSTAMRQSGIVTAEQLMLWNPDVIVTGIKKIGSSGDRMNDLRKLTALKAVQNDALHYCPIGAFWWDRPSPEAILGILWLSQILYPDLFADLDLKRETKEFYRTFYQYNLTDAEYASFAE
ncbi:ABC transporter substrate-binding protein [Desulfobulbus rhabdoformis]|uniref:ABC transporter substrate-binding protein n=1 Tax=Desulfobulbus rhabdoformis TaxID=34032 RepID=UPI0019665D58|nr:ABC transporter substrate-binding protein [Desulfobulbus rhabdoformis]MBM9612873.1 ABC transporter substrate-binding protein [Desulfobulbus rhabdoformis]